MNPQKVIDRASARIQEDLLPDRCTIETVTGTPTISDMGVVTHSPAYLSYNGSTSIPCRFDNSRSFRPERLPNQEINVNEYVLHLPKTVFAKPNDKIRASYGGRIRVFEVRKQSNLSTWRATNEALIVELEGQHD